MNKLCELCSKEIITKYGSGRFCSDTCARSYSSRIKRPEVNRKVSQTLRGRKSFLSKEKCLEIGRKAGETRRKISLEKDKTRTWNELSESSKRNRLYQEQDSNCFNCGIKDWQEHPIKLQLHHIDGNRFNNLRENCCLLCPNCHSQTKTYCSRNQGNKISDFEIEQILLKNNGNLVITLKDLRLAYGGSNWYRCKRIMYKLGMC